MDNMITRASMIRYEDGGEMRKDVGEGDEDGVR